MTSFTVTGTMTFTRSHAEYVAAKVATDLARIRHFYDFPSDSRIMQYEAELIALLAQGYLEKVIYGFQRNGVWIEPTLRYTPQDIFSDSATNDDPGKIRVDADISGASWGSYLTYSPAWGRLTEAQRIEFCKILPFQRTEGQEPSISGHFNVDRTYSSGGRALARASLGSPR